MIKKDITYTNLNGESVTKTAYFHFKLAELVEMEAQEGETLSARLLAVGSSANGAQILKTFKDLVEQAYGRKTDDGDFEKDPVESAKFMRSLAFDQLLVELMSNQQLAAEFVNGLFPADLQKTASEIAAASGDDLQAKIDEAVAAAQANGRVLDSVEVRELVLSPLQDSQSGLDHPRDKDGKLYPWAFREPTQAELTRMAKPQMLEVFARKSKGWTPPPQVEDAKPV